MRLHNYIQDKEVQEDAYQLLEFAIFLEEYERLDEGIIDKMGDLQTKASSLFKNMGFHVTQGKGLIQYLWTTNKNILILIYNAMMYSTGSEKEKVVAKEEIDKIVKSVTKEDMINFLYKLDSLTLHTFSAPLKIIDALTGWHIAGEVEKKIVPAIELAKRAIEWLEAAKTSLTDKMKLQMEKYINALRRVFGFSDFHKLKEA